MQIRILKDGLGLPNGQGSQPGKVYGIETFTEDQMVHLAAGGWGELVEEAPVEVKSEEEKPAIVEAVIRKSPKTADMEKVRKWGRGKK